MFAYIGAPNRVPGAPKGAPNRSKSTEAAKGGSKKFSEKL